MSVQYVKAPLNNVKQHENNFDVALVMTEPVAEYKIKIVQKRFNQIGRTSHPAFVNYTKDWQENAALFLLKVAYMNTESDPQARAEEFQYLLDEDIPEIFDLLTFKEFDNFANVVLRLTKLSALPVRKKYMFMTKETFNPQTFSMLGL